MNGGIRISKLTMLLLALLILVSISGLGTAAEIFVQPGDSIQTAVNNADPGDIITVKAGNYSENIKITKGNLTIRSESGNPDNTIIQAKSLGSIFLLQGSNIKITGLKIIGSSKFGCTGVNLSSASNCTVENNKFLNNARGIYILRSNGNKISKNIITDSREYGMALQYSTNNTVLRNKASESQRGIYFGTSDDNTFSSNIIQNNSVFGLFVCGRSDRNLIYNNYFNDTSMTIRNGTGNAYYITKTAGTNIVGGPYIGGNFWAKPDGKGFSQTAVDKDGDGISDSVYKNLMGSKYTDSFPLVDPNSPEPVLPVAAFSSNISSGNSPLVVSFADKSTGTPSTWKWSFGDGTYSTSKNPVHTYSAAGNYTVSLTVSNNAGSNTATKSNFIKVTVNNAIQKPVVSFWGSRISGTAPLTLGFTDASTGTPTAWNWSFGDGTYSTDQGPKHTYSKAGNYTVTLTASNSAGSGTKTRTGYIKVTASVQKPIASFSSNVTSGNSPLNVAFTDKSTETPTLWNWSFGDGTYSTQQNPVHIYSKSGNYTVTLTASNSAGSNKTTMTSYIKVTQAVTKPLVSFWGSRTSGTVPLTIGFTDASTGSPTAWNWSFGDGTYSTLKSPRHTFSKAGNYSITLTVSNAAGSGTKTRSNYIKLV